jgi:hypothetical protein
VINKLKQRCGPTELRWWGDELALAISLGGASAQQGDTPETFINRAARVLDSALGIANKNAGSELGRASQA